MRLNSEIEQEFMPAEGVVSVDVHMDTSGNNPYRYEHDMFTITITPGLGTIGRSDTRFPERVAESYQPGSFVRANIESSDNETYLRMLTPKYDETEINLTRLMQEAVANILTEEGIGPMIFVSEVTNETSELQ